MSIYKDFPKYYDLHTTGLGYASRLREVRTQGQSFWAVDINALRGSADLVGYTRFDVRISGREALDVLKRFKPDIDAKKKVLIGFKIGDTYPEAFVHEKGERAGQTGVVIKGRLVQVAWVKVDGSLGYSARDDAQAGQDYGQAA